MPSPLLQFLAQARSAALRPTTPTSLILVLGNPSCDLDSFVSATIYSFFHSQVARTRRSNHLHVPVLNLPSTPSSELWRLRPEFGTALRLALDGQDSGEEDRQGDGDRRLLENLLTVSDIRSTPSSLFCRVFSGPTSTVEKASVVLVDHNALSVPIPNMSPSVLASKLSVIACIDHHVDESSVPTTASPRIITTGIGSCTTLVVQHLRDQGFGQALPSPIDGHTGAEPDAVATVELATLSLASVLIDTANLTAEGKVSETDREVVAYLEDIINSTSVGRSTPRPTPETPQVHWDRTAFYEQISSSKANSLSLLSLAEIFDRDYKCWSEATTSTSTKLNLGIASVVKPTSWLIKKADSAEQFSEAMRDFARDQTPSQGLDLFVVMTTSTSPHGEFRRELLVLRTGQGAESQKAMERFEEMAREELRLEVWSEDEEFVSLLEREHGGRTGRIWWQRDVKMSRKQVAPLLREAMRAV